MKHIVLFACLAFAYAAHAQQENWDTYAATFSGRPGSILVNLSLIEHAPDSRYPFLLVTGPHSRKCKANGLPANEEIPELEEVLDATSKFLDGVTANVLAGTFTTNCQRLNYYYIRDTQSVRNALARMYAQNYGDFKYAVKLKQDAEWVSYRTFLYPDDKMKQWMAASKTISEMMHRGDSLVRPRDINFTFYFKTDTGRQQFAAFAKANSFKADTFSYANVAYPYGITFSKYGYVKADIIALMENELKGELEKYQARYDGWAAPLPGK